MRKEDFTTAPLATTLQSPNLLDPTLQLHRLRFNLNPASVNMKLSCGTLIFLGLVLATGPTVVSARQLLQDAEHSDPALREGTIVHDRLYNTSVTSVLAEMRGTWLGLGDQYPENVWDSFDTYELPNCEEHVDHFNYEHYNPYDDHFITMAGSEGNVQRTTASHERTTIFNVASYQNGLIRMVNNATGVESCANWQPFVDLRTGELKAESVNMYLWTTNSTGGANYTSMACEVLGDEVSGCYTTDVARNPAAVGMAAAPPTLAADSPLMIRPSGSVISVSISTYVCRNGECLKYSPKYVHEH